jgi:glutamate formiminotransferase
MNRIVECVPNFSEGSPARGDRRHCASDHFCRKHLLIGPGDDPDHNRAVVTIAGPPDSIGRSCRSWRRSRHASQSI